MILSSGSSLKFHHLYYENKITKITSCIKSFWESAVWPISTAIVLQAPEGSLICGHVCVLHRGGPQRNKIPSLMLFLSVSLELVALDLHRCQCILNMVACCSRKVLLITSLVCRRLLFCIVFVDPCMIM